MSIQRGSNVMCRLGLFRFHFQIALRFAFISNYLFIKRILFFFFYLDIFSYSSTDELTKMTKDWSGYQGNSLKDPIKCHAYISDEFCLRVNTLPSYTYINRQVTLFLMFLVISFSSDSDSDSSFFFSSEMTKYYRLLFVLL